MGTCNAKVRDVVPVLRRHSFPESPLAFDSSNPKKYLVLRQGPLDPKSIGPTNEPAPGSRLDPMALKGVNPGRLTGHSTEEMSNGCKRGYVLDELHD
jgi:hypothetical protein